MAEETVNNPTLTARQVAEQNPELDKLRQIAFGTNYLDDLDANRGTARFYSGFGMQPDYLNTAAGTEQAVAEAVAAEAEAAAAPVIETGSGESIQSQATGDLTDNTRFEQNLINQGAGVQRAPGQPVVAPGEVPVTQQEMDEFNFPALTQDSTAEEISRDLANQQAALPSDQNIMDEVALTGENTGILSTLLDVGSAIVSPVGTLVKKGLDAIPQSRSQIEYESYNPAQQQAIDTAYGTGGVMEGYNKVSALGEGALATVNERIANREANVSDPVNDKTLQELKTLRDTLDPQPVTYIQDPDTGDAKIAERIAAEERAANAPDAYTILGEEEDTKQGVGPKYSDELDFRGDYLGTYGSPVQYDELDDIESQATALEEALGVSPTTYETPAPTYSYEGSDEQDRDQETAARELAAAQEAANRDAARGGGGDSGGGGGKIVCTMMNETYGFGSFRNKIWLRQSKDLAPEYQKGYHKIFLPLVKLSKTNKIVRKILEHIAVHRTIDIRQETRGKTHILGRVYRKVLEPICYLVGKYAKR